MKPVFAALFPGLFFLVFSAWANPLPEPMELSEFSTNPDWIEVYGYPGSLPYVQFTVNGDTVRIKADAIERLMEKLPSKAWYEERYYFVLDQTSTTGFDMTIPGGRIQMMNPLDYGTGGSVPAPPRGESVAVASLYQPSRFVYDERWSLDESPTPGAPNDNKPLSYGSSAVVVNEVYTGGSGAPFIELYNAGEKPADIGGWSIAANERFRIPPGTTIAPGERVVFNASVFPGGFALPPEAGTFCLENAEGVIVERFGWSGGGEPGYSRIRFPDGFATTFFSWNKETAFDFRGSQPTPGAPNREIHPVTAIAIEQDSVTVIPGERYQFFCRGTDMKSQTFRMLPEWRLEGDFATVDNRGGVTGITCGSGVLHALHQGLTARVKVFGAVAGTLDADAVWRAENNPYRVTGTLHIPSGVTLAIEPGVTVVFEGDYGFHVEGQILARGEEYNPVLFTSGEENPLPENWYGIKISRGKSLFRHCIVEYANQGITLHGDLAAYTQEPVHEIDGCIFKDNRWAIYTDNVKATIRNCRVTGNSTTATSGILVSYGDSVLVMNNTLAFLHMAINTPGIVLSDKMKDQPTIINNCVYCCEYGISPFNSRTPIVAYNNVAVTGISFRGGASGLGFMTMINARGDSCDVFHNISADPCFVDPEKGDFRLRPGSPCIDAGDPSRRDDDGSVSDIGGYTGTKALGTGREGAPLPAAVVLRQNSPNPFNPVTTISFALPAAGRVRLEVYDSLGQKICTLVDGQMSAGEHSVVLDGSRYASGVYFCTLRVGAAVETRKMLLVR